MSKFTVKYVCPVHGHWRPPHAPKRVCDGCWACYGMFIHAKQERDKIQSKGRAKGGGQSSKKKGRSGVLAVQQSLLGAAPWLCEADIFIKATSQMGVDLHLSPLAQQWFPFAIEVKNVELLNIWKALQQAEANAAEGRPPIVLFKRAGTRLYAALRIEDLLSLLPCPHPTIPDPKP